MKFAHIINPVKVPATSELGIAQPITFESIRIAQEFAREKVAVETYTICYEEDREIIPTDFIQLPNLTRSVLDLKSFSKQKKYPVLTDVLTALYKASNAEFLIFTNMDISLMPQFYVAVAAIIETEKCDALMVNRRGISTKYKSVAELPLMYADLGKPHPGFDCFVFKRELLNKLILENICVGVSFSEVAMVHNLIAFAEKLKLIDDLHLTFHLGSEVMPPLDSEYYRHNRNEYEQKIYPRLKPYLDIKKFPYSALPVHKRVLKWILNPSFRTHQVLEMEGKSLARRLKYKVDSIRFSVMNKLK